MGLSLRAQAQVIYAYISANILNTEFKIQSWCLQKECQKGCLTLWMTTLALMFSNTRKNTPISVPTLWTLDLRTDVSTEIITAKRMSVSRKRSYWQQCCLILPVLIDKRVVPRRTVSTTKHISVKLMDTEEIWGHEQQRSRLRLISLPSGIIPARRSTADPEWMSMPTWRIASVLCKNSTFLIINIQPGDKVYLHMKWAENLNKWAILIYSHS